MVLWDSHADVTGTGVKDHAHRRPIRPGKRPHGTVRAASLPSAEHQKGLPLMPAKLDTTPEDSVTVAIIGGGFTGAAVALQLARSRSLSRTGRSLRVLVFEPRVELGRGLAYDTRDPAHRINVPAAKMSLDPGHELEFQNWYLASGDAGEDDEALAADGKLYPRRAAFGRYVFESIRPYLEDGTVRHIRSLVERVQPEGDRFEIRDQDDIRHAADHVVIATSHPPPSAPGTLGTILSGDPRFIPDATKPNALSVVGVEDRVLIIGAGLTAADVIASLDKKGHRGKITVFSRRGLRSRGHATVASEPIGDFLTPPARSVRSLVRRVREAVKEAEARGLGWQPVFDQLRGQGGQIWRALPPEERRRLVRHIRPFWDVHRFRIAPQLMEVLDRRVVEGSLRFLAASLLNVDYAGHAAPIGITLRHRASQTVEDLDVDVVVVTTGPAHGSIIAHQAYLRGLNAQGLVRIDDSGLGIACDDQSRALDRYGAATPGLYIAGPLARGTFGELMGLPQVSEHAIAVANEIARTINDKARAAPASSHLRLVSGR